jgi:hypothetical protein
LSIETRRHPLSKRYVATFRAVYDADNDVEAAVVADQIRLNAEQDLDEEDGDSFECSQVTSNALELTPDETLSQLRRARNLLIKTRIKQCYELAREMDQLIYALQFRDQPDFTMGGYDFGQFMDLTMAILERGEEPNV